MPRMAVLLLMLAITAPVFCIQTRAAIPPDSSPIISAAQAVLDRTTDGNAKNIRMEVIPAEANRDAYEYQAEDGSLTLRGSSSVALCRAFYDYVKTSHLGLIGWDSPRLMVPAHWPDASPTRVVCPYQIRHAYNVVTAGYTFPYWTWERWQQELDWQALHGFNMLMAPTATEAIAQRVWLSLGLTQQEIDQDTCGPAHLPWFRMGNICGLNGPLPQQWHTDQIALQHKILDRMRELRMQPVVQSFAGFVPHGYARLHPETKLLGTEWISSLPKKNRPVMMLPDDPQFTVITKAYMDEWAREFGPARYFLVDSFNEMQIPKTTRPETELLADYGQKTLQAMHAANPTAIWAIQGWTFGYQDWSTKNLAALFSKVPDDQMLVLDYANDYANSWGKYDAFYGKSWVFGYVPNMGGKTAYTGNLDFYAKASAGMLQSDKHRNVTGFTISGEGLENNAANYELLTDMAWSREPINLDTWFTNYSINRYGACPPAMAEAWKILRQSCYSNLVPHPGFSWQHYGSVDRNVNFFAATDKFLSCSDELKSSPGYRADAIEWTALAISLRADAWYTLAKNAAAAGDDAQFDQASAKALDLLTQIDRLMESHPLHRLERWIDFAKSHGDTPELKKFYESDARSIVTYWGPGVSNYSCRVWGGLVRDYYRPWLLHEFDAIKTGKTFDTTKFMLDYVNASGTSPFVNCVDPVQDAKDWFKQLMEQGVPAFAPNAENIAQWHPDQITTDWKTVEWTISSDQLARLRSVMFTYTSGAHRLEVQTVQVVADGKVVAEDKHFGYAGLPDSRNIYSLKIPAGTASNNSCVIRAIIKGGGGTDSNGNVGLILAKDHN